LIMHGIETDWTFIEALYFAVQTTTVRKWISIWYLKQASFHWSNPI
jgi:hypothetical protein